MAIQIKIETNKLFDDLTKKFGGFSKILIPEISRGLLMYGFEVEKQSKKETPVDHGALRGSIKTTSNIQLSNLEVVVAPREPAVSYASWIHEGRRYDPRFGLVILKGGGRARTPVGGHPYMRIGSEKSEDFGRRTMRDAVQSAINKLKS